MGSLTRERYDPGTHVLSVRVFGSSYVGPLFMTTISTARVAGSLFPFVCVGVPCACTGVHCW